MTPMTYTEFWVIFICCAVTMLICRVVPLFALKNRELPDLVQKGLGFIPPAAFAALVANDLITPGMFSAGLWPAAAPLVAGLIVMVVAYKTKSLVWSAVVGVACYALLSLI